MAFCSAQVLDVTPDPFAFAAKPAVAKNVMVESSSVTVNGINGRASISIVGGEYSVGCSGLYLAVSAVNAIANNETICVRHTSASTANVSVSTTLTVGGVAGMFTSTTAPIVCNLDVIASGTPLPVPDGLLLLRYMLGFRGNGLMQGLSISGPRNAVADIEAFLSASDYSATGTAGKPASIDGMIFLRLLQGVPDSALLSGINVPAGATFRDAAAIRANVNARCGTTF